MAGIPVEIGRNPSGARYKDRAKRWPIFSRFLSKLSELVKSGNLGPQGAGVRLFPRIYLAVIRG
jgi:hypothetical protein